MTRHKRRSKSAAERRKAAHAPARVSSRANRIMDWLLWGDQDGHEAVGELFRIPERAVRH